MIKRQQKIDYVKCIQRQYMISQRCVATMRNFSDKLNTTELKSFYIIEIIRRRDAMCWDDRVFRRQSTNRLGKVESRRISKCQILRIFSSRFANSFFGIPKWHKFDDKETRGENEQRPRTRVDDLRASSPCSYRAMRMRNLTDFYYLVQLVVRQTFIFLRVGNLSLILISNSRQWNSNHSFSSLTKMSHRSTDNSLFIIPSIIIVIIVYYKSLLYNFQCPTYKLVKSQFHRLVEQSILCFSNRRHLVI